MTELTQAELKNIQINMLQDVDKICRDYNINYSLAYGTLIGAVRHKGFIPWDDDIDIMMPRVDYMKFIQICQGLETPFNLLSLRTDDSFGCLFTKLSDRNTILIEENTKTTKKNLGVYIDVFPIDFLGDTKEKAVKKYNSFRVLTAIFDASIWKRFKKSKRKAFYYEPLRFILFVLGKFIKPNTLGKYIEKKILNECSKEKAYSGCIGTMYGSKDTYPTPMFDINNKMEFEGKKYPVIVNYDDFLSSIYGNYMTMPPESKRITHHDFKAYWK